MAMSAPEVEANLPDDDGDEAPSDPEVDVAALMGFGSFGSKPHLKKKRKLNESGNAGTGANSVQLPVNPRKRREEVQGEDERSTYGSLPAKPAGQADDGGSPRPSHHQADNAGFEAYNSAVTAEAHAIPRERGKMPNGDWNWYALRKGVRDENGDMAYFDKSFVEDPWARLKKEDAPT